MKYQIFVAEDWFEVKKGEIIHSPWVTKALEYELHDGTSGHTVHWRGAADAQMLGTGEESVRWDPAFRPPTKNIA
jgi:hypothetical protein